MIQPSARTVALNSIQMDQRSGTSRTVDIARGKRTGNRRLPDRARQGGNHSYEPEPLTIGRTVTAFRAHRVRYAAAHGAQSELGER